MLSRPGSTASPARSTHCCYFYPSSSLCLAPCVPIRHYSGPWKRLCCDALRNHSKVAQMTGAAHGCGAMSRQRQPSQRTACACAKTGAEHLRRVRRPALAAPPAPRRASSGAAPAAPPPSCVRHCPPAARAAALPETWAPWRPRAGASAPKWSHNKVKARKAA